MSSMCSAGEQCLHVGKGEGTHFVYLLCLLLLLHSFHLGVVIVTGTHTPKTSENFFFFTQM